MPWRSIVKILDLLANPASSCITFDIVLYLVVSDVATWCFLVLTDYIQFLTSLKFPFCLVDVAVLPLPYVTVAIPRSYPFVDDYLMFPVFLSFCLRFNISLENKRICIRYLMAINLLFNCWLGCASVLSFNSVLYNVCQLTSNRVMKLIHFFIKLL